MRAGGARRFMSRYTAAPPTSPAKRSEEHTSELQSQSNLVCRLLLEKKNRNAELSGNVARKQRSSTAEGDKSEGARVVAGPDTVDSERLHDMVHQDIVRAVCLLLHALLMRLG